MAALRAHLFSVSLDGFGAGSGQSLDDPLGAGGEDLHKWMFATPTLGAETGVEGVDDMMIREARDGFGATIMGRNMFGPVRGPWPDESWTGWWGDSPPFGHPVFVLTGHARESVEMKGGTTFHFVTGGVHEARERALEAAGGLDVNVAGGVSTLRQYLAEGLIDSLNLTLVPIFLGQGERLFDGLPMAGYTCTRVLSSDTVAHLRFSRAG